MSGLRCRAHGWHLRKQLAGLQQTWSGGSAVGGKVKTKFHSAARGFLLHGERPRRPKADFTTRPLCFHAIQRACFVSWPPELHRRWLVQIPWSDPAPLRSAPRPGRNSWGLSLNDNYASGAERRKNMLESGCFACRVCFGWISRRRPGFKPFPYVFKHFSQKNWLLLIFCKCVLSHGAKLVKLVWFFFVFLKKCATIRQDSRRRLIYIFQHPFLPLHDLKAGLFHH